MYLALRWLIGLSLAMWVAICSIDLYNERIKRNQYKGFSINPFKSENISSIVKRQSIDVKRQRSLNSNGQHDTASLHYAMFFAGAFAVSLFNRKKEIILYTRRKITHMNIFATQFLTDNIKLKNPAINVSVAIVKYTVMIWEYCKEVIKDCLLKRKALRNHYKIHSELLKKVKEYEEERKNLGQFLISAIRENKNIRIQYQMETMAKKRLLQYVEDTQKQIKENYSKYVSFQRLYLVTHQENIYLKARLQKLYNEKEKTEKNLIDLVNEVYQSKNHELKAYCSRFIVGSRENLLSCDVNKEIQKFLRKTVVPSSSYQDTFEYSNIESDISIAEIESNHDTIVPMIPNAPKLKGLPGECIWTVKDKDGIIENLYEYDYESNFEKGDTIRRIRKYSVYHDKDCLLDFENSQTALRNLSSATITVQQQQYIQVEYPLATNRFLTGSQAFQKFLQDNQSFSHLSSSHKPALLCE